MLGLIRQAQDKSENSESPVKNTRGSPVKTVLASFQQQRSDDASKHDKPGAQKVHEFCKMF